MREMQLRDAKAGLSAVVDDAINGKPVVITRRGKREAVVLGFKDWQKLSKVPSFGRLLMAAPLKDADLVRRDRRPIKAPEF
jgi:prevent-host-death family protein